MTKDAVAIWVCILLIIAVICSGAWYVKRDLTPRMECVEGLAFVMHKHGVTQMLDPDGKPMICVYDEYPGD